MPLLKGINVTNHKPEPENVEQPILIFRRSLFLYSFVASLAVMFPGLAMMAHFKIIDAEFMESWWWFCFVIGFVCPVGMFSIRMAMLREPLICCFQNKIS
ncbi:MAG: hypothetical protein JWM11_3908, partial [Planctomycetaceae bacterium]|nr:hypothetical protein [Planctomycetaceae bacterium]